MSTLLQPITAAPVLLPLQADAQTAQRYAAMAAADNTKRAYRADWADFAAWCDAKGLVALPAEPATVGLYAASLAGTHKVSTIRRRLASIAKRHRDAGLESPASMRLSAVHDVVRGITREKGARPDAKRALATDELRRMVKALPETLAGLRDRALLLVGFAGGFRRSELAALTVEDIEVTDDGLRVLIGRSKTDQEGLGREVGIPYGSTPATCPVRNYKHWIEAAGITTGPVFRPFHNQVLIAEAISDRAVALVIKRAAAAVGLEADSLAGHSLRSGMATAAARNGASERSIMAQTGHRSVAMVRRYIRVGELFADNAGARLGL